MKYLLILLATFSLGLISAQGADKQNAKGCCNGGKCCVKQQGCCEKSHK